MTTQDLDALDARVKQMTQGYAFTQHKLPYTQQWMVASKLVLNVALCYDEKTAEGIVALINAAPDLIAAARKGMR